MMTEFKWHLRGTCQKFGDDIVHDGPIMPFKFAKERTSDPAVLIPNLFVGVDPTFPARVKQGDIVVAGRNFGKGKAHFGGYIAMRALGLGVLCESMPFLCFRAAVSVGLLIAAECDGISREAEQGDDLEVDFLEGELVNHTRGTRATFRPVPEGLRETIALGGTPGVIRQWWETVGKHGGPAPTA
jgi:3-isopropylmalate/(R)-2-methylmalate dehydratase small subunit